ncbi:MAG TPA: DUF2806 domain-containing protein [Clostridia bacterium]|nr:DUF2806 domain-containing protein [Clostridia bacterium]
MGAVSDIVKAGVEPISKFIDAVSRGIGCLYEPTKIKKLAAAKASEISIVADAIRKNDDLPIIYNRDGVQIDASDYLALAERANSRLVFQEMRKQQNIEAIVEKAYREVETFSEVSSEPVDDDWIVRFFNSVEDVSDEKLQEIWAKLLAGEIKKPRSSSQRTLDLLKNLSPDEAMLFEKASVCVLESGAEKYIPDETSLLKEQGISFRDLFTLSDAGLINLSELTVTSDLSCGDSMIFNDKIVCILKAATDESPKSIQFVVRCLTWAGTEIFRALTSDSDQRVDFALKYFRKLKDEKTNLIVSAYNVVAFEGNGVRYKKNNLLE